MVDPPLLTLVLDCLGTLGGKAGSAGAGAGDGGGRIGGDVGSAGDSGDDGSVHIVHQLRETSRNLAIDLMTKLGQHNITVAQLKRIFRLMHTSGDYRLGHAWRLVDAVEAMVVDGSGTLQVGPASPDGPNGGSNGLSAGLGALNGVSAAYVGSLHRGLLHPGGGWGS